MKKDSLELLIKLCEVQSSSSNDKDIMNFLKKHITEELSLEYEEDSFGNLYVTKGKGEKGYKCIVSHTDTVHEIYEYRKVYIDNGYLFAVGCLDEMSILTQVGIGGDDRVGIFMCLEALNNFDDIKAVFFRFEETGCRGSKASNIDFFEDCNFVIQADRKGYGDFIRNSKGIEMCSNEFVDEMKPLYEKYGYKIVSGISTDVNQLKENGLKVCAINLGCGYYQPHSNKEVIYVPNVISCYKLIHEMFIKYGEKRYEHLYVKPTYSYDSRSSKRDWGFSTTLPLNLWDNKTSFTNKTDNHFFKKRILDDLFVPIESTGETIIDRLTEDRYKDFWKIEGDREVYYYTETEPIPVSTNIMYNPIEDLFYNIQLNSHIINSKELNKLKKEFSILDTGSEFVYSNYYGYWIKKEDSKWDEIVETWILKSENFK